MARVPYLRREDSTSVEHIAVFDRLEAERRVPTPFIFRALANAPRQLDGLLTYARSLRQASELGPRLRELVILAIAHAKQDDYIAAHHYGDGLEAGFRREQLDTIPDIRARRAVFTDAEIAVLDIGTAIGLHGDVTDDVWAAGARHLNDTQLVQLVLTASWYAAGMIQTRVLRLDLEAEYREEPPQQTAEGTP